MMAGGATAQMYEYRARDTRGKVVKGRIEAGSESAVIARLTTMGVAPLGIREVGAGTGLQAEITIPGLEKGVGLKDLAVMSRQMSTMISAGLSILQTLNILATQTENKKLAKVLNDVRSDVETGHSLSDSFARHEREFPPLMINLIRAGETGGFLEKSMDAIAMNFEKEVKLRDKVKAALTYPVIVLIMAILGVALMLIFIVPVFTKMYGDLGSQLPLPTQFLVSLSAAMVWLGPLTAVLIVAGAIWWGRNKHKESVRNVVDPIKLKLPVFGALTAKIAIARFARNFSTMIGSGVPILRSLSIVGETSGNMVIEKALLRVQDSVRTGGTIAGPLMTEPVFPSMVTQMMAVGEDAGALEPMLEKIAVFYDSEVESMTDQLTALIEPLMIAFLGIIIGGMIVALYMPMFGIISEVGGS